MWSGEGGDFSQRLSLFGILYQIEGVKGWLFSTPCLFAYSLIVLTKGIEYGSFLGSLRHVMATSIDELFCCLICVPCFLVCLLS